MKVIKRILAASIFLIFSSAAWTEENGSKADVAFGEQRTVVVVDSDYDYNLNPQTANYTTEAQVLTGQSGT